MSWHEVLTGQIRSIFPSLVVSRGTSILGEVRNVEIPGPTQQLLCSKSHDFLVIFPLAHSKIKQIAEFLDEIIQEVSD